MTVASAAPSEATTADERVRVMVVDDSLVIRGVIASWITAEPEFVVVARHRNGRNAADDVTRSLPDVIILDIEMPEMDGLTALPLLLERKPGTAVIVASTLTRRGAEISLRALTLGAADCVPKPGTGGGLVSAADFRTDLVAKVRALGRRARGRRGGAVPIGRLERPLPARRAAAGTASPSIGRAGGAMSEHRRTLSGVPPRVLVIGASTGGPQALARLFTDLGPLMARLPVLVAQHMPPTFTAILAEHIGRAAERPAAEGRDGEPVEPGRIYVAPGGRHMLVERAGHGPIVRLSDAPPVNFCRPAVDPLFEAAAASYGAATLAAILTGMGSDGARGATAVADAGGSVIAQDEGSSVVWGMPGAAVGAGACAMVLPIDEIGRRIGGLLGGARA
jgi:two-component system chemotaxis response regulator CheB